MQGEIGRFQFLRIYFYISCSNKKRKSDKLKFNNYKCVYYHTAFDSLFASYLQR